MAIELLNLWQSLVVEVFGSQVLFLFALLFGIIVLSVLLRFSQKTTAVFLVTTTLIVSYFINKLLALVLLLVLTGIGLAYSRLISRG